MFRSKDVGAGLAPAQRYLHNYYAQSTMDYSSYNLPLLLERAGVRRIKSAVIFPLIQTFSLKGEGAGTCLDTHATEPYACP